MEKRVNYVLSWTCNGHRHTKEYDSEQIALICFNECKSIKRHTDVTLVRVSAELLDTTKEEKRRQRVFTIIKYRPGTGMKDKYYEINPDQIVDFEKCLSDRDIFSVMFYLSDTVPPFVRRSGFTNLTKIK